MPDGGLGISGRRGNILSEPNRSVAKAVTKAVVVECCSVENTAVVPNCCHQVSSESLLAMPGKQRTDVILVLPLQAGLQVVVLVDQVKEPLQEVVALLLRHAVDIRHMATNGEDTLPPCHRVGAHDWVDCLELESNVLRGATGLIIEFEPAFLSDFLEEWLGKGPGQPLEELLVWFADAIVDLITRCPERV